MSLSPEEIARRKSLTLGQAEGWTALPRQLNKDEVDPKLRSQVTDLFDGLYNFHLANRMSGEGAPGFLFRHLWAEFEAKPQSSLPNTHYQAQDWYRKRLATTEPEDFYELLHVAARGLKLYSESTRWQEPRATYLNALDDLATLLADGLAPYRAHKEGILYPAIDEHTRELVSAAIDATGQIGGGVKSHFRGALQCLSKGEFAKSIKESWDTLESYVTQLGGEPASFEKSLRKLTERGLVPNLMAGSWNKLLGYANTTPGIRHPLREDESSKATEADAIYMLSVCGAAIVYLRSVTT